MYIVKKFFKSIFSIITTLTIAVSCVSCSDKSNASIEGIPVQLEDAKAWSIVSPDGEILVKNAFEASPSFVYNGRFVVYEKDGFYVYDINNIHAIVLGYFKGYIEIKSIECEIDLSSIGYMLFQPCYVNAYPTDTVTHFKCCINADCFKKEFDKFIKGQENKVSEPYTKKEIKKYPPQQQAMYDFIVNSIRKNGRYKIDPLTLRKVLNIGSSKEDTDVLNSAVSLLNRCYKDINKTNKPLLKKVKRTDLYDISIDFKI